jgi:hypothetical protein
MIASTVVKGFINYDLGRNATIVIELAVGLAVGLAAQTARRAHAELERATRLAASLEERARLSRQVHDGAIQVLALVSRRGREIGGETAELAELAGVQERALRRRRATDRVSVSVPAEPVLLDAGVADELYSAAANALDDVASHAGPDARAYVLLEDLGDSARTGSGCTPPASRLRRFRCSWRWPRTTSTPGVTSGWRAPAASRPCWRSSAR